MIFCRHNFCLIIYLLLYRYSQEAHRLIPTVHSVYERYNIRPLRKFGIVVVVANFFYSYKQVQIHYQCLRIYQHIMPTTISTANAHSNSCEWGMELPNSVSLSKNPYRIAVSPKSKTHVPIHRLHFIHTNTTRKLNNFVQIRLNVLYFSENLVFSNV